MTLVTPPPFLARFGENNLGISLGSLPRPSTDAVTTWPNWLAVDWTAVTGLTWTNGTSSTPRNPPFLRHFNGASVMSLVNCLPSREIVNATEVPGLCATIWLVSWFQVLTLWPSTATTLSPLRSPASTAGDLAADGGQFTCVALAGTQAVTLIVVVFCSPMASATAKISTKPITKCMNEPASSTTLRCHGGLARNVLGSSAGSTASRLLMPVMSTNPPRGNALMPYSVSPRVRDQTV